MIVAVRRSHQTLATRDTDFKSCDAAIRVFSGDQESHREWPETNGLVGRIDVEAEIKLLHRCLP
jgi:hypothetical protein